MAKLTFKEFRCAVDTNESGDESPYFLTWVGDLKLHECRLKFTRKAFWENKVSPGPWWPVNDVVIDSPVFDLSPMHTIALAAMVEEDEGTDLSGAEINAINAEMKTVLLNHIQSGAQAQHASFINTMRNTLRSKILGKLSSAVGADDDLMEEDDWKAVRRIVLTGTGNLDLVTFKGGDGQYQARYQKG
jgi:hypothetical protein